MPHCLMQVQLTGFTHTTLAVQGCAARTGASKGRWPHTSFSSTSTLMNTQSGKSSAILTNVGPMRWHGPHHVAVKSTHTSCGVEASQGRQAPALHFMLRWRAAAQRARRRPLVMQVRSRAGRARALSVVQGDRGGGRTLPSAFARVSSNSALVFTCATIALHCCLHPPEQSRRPK